MSVFPINPIDIVKMIVPVVKEILSFFKDNEKSNENLANTNGIDDNTNVEDVDSVVEKISKSRKELQDEAAKIESAVMGEVKFYLEELHSILSEKKENVERYGIRLSRMEKNLERVEGKIRKSMDDEISKRMSLDNNECFRIMKMIPGEKKKNALSDFMNETVNIALDRGCEEINVVLKDFFEEISEELLEAIDVVKNECVKNSENLLSVDADNYKEKSLEIQRDAGTILSACEIVDVIMKGEV